MAYINPIIYQNGVSQTLGTNYYVALASTAPSGMISSTSFTGTLKDLGVCALGIPTSQIDITGNVISIPTIDYKNTSALDAILGPTGSTTAAVFFILQTTTVAATTADTTITSVTAIKDLATTDSVYTTKTFYLMVEGSLSNSQTIYSGNQFKLNATTVTISSADA